MLSLKDPSLLGLCAAEPGQQDASAARFTVRNPATGAVITHVADFNVARVRDAINTAYIARPAWAARTANDRCSVMLRWSRLMLENIDDLSIILTSEMGKPLAEARSEIAYAASYVEWFAEEGRRIYGDVIPAHGQDRRIPRQQHEPVWRHHVLQMAL